MNIRDDSETPNDILNEFYTQYHLGEEGGNYLPYVIIEFTSFLKIYIPNWNDRRKAVLRHDIHHILTGYKSEILGEFEIAGWEIGSGCMNYWAAYILNSGGLLVGLLVYPLPTFRAFILGCRTTNLYQVNMTDDEIKHTTIHDLKNQIGLTTNINGSNPKLSEVLKLIYHYIFSLILNLVVVIFYLF